MGKNAYKGEVSKLKPRSITYMGAVIKYYRTKKKVLDKLDETKKQELEELLEKYESRFKINTEVSIGTTLSQIAIITYLWNNPSDFSGSISGITGLWVAKMTNGNNGRKNIKRAYLILENYLNQ